MTFPLKTICAIGLALITCSFSMDLAIAKVLTNGQQGGEFRTVKCPLQYSVGTLRAVASSANASSHNANELPAKGDVIMEVPHGQLLALELNGNVVKRPELIDQLSEVPVDIVIVKNMLSMKDLNGSSADTLAGGIAGMKRVQKVIFARCDITDSGASQLAKMPHLKSLLFNVCESVTGKCFSHLAKCPELTEINLSVSPRADMTSFQYLSYMPKLKVLCVNQTGLNKVGSSWLGKCSNLRILDLRKNASFDDDCLSSILSLKKLERLNVSGTSVTLSRLKQLKVLHLKELLVSSFLADDPERFHQFETELSGTTVALVKPSDTNITEITRWYEDRRYRGPSRK